MKNTITSYDPTYPPINKEQGLVNEPFRIWMQQVTQRGLLIGTGSPEGNVEAQQGDEYMDETGATGSVKYIKQQADIGGDKKQGWVAIG